MAGMNRVQVMGFLGGDPQVRYIASGRAVANFSIATTEKWKDAQGQPQERTDWHRITVWGKQAEVCAEYLKKGSQALVEGRLQYDQYTPAKCPPDVKVNAATIVADSVHFLDRGAKRHTPSDPGRPVRGGDAGDAGSNEPPPPTDEDAFGPPPPGYGS